MKKLITISVLTLGLLGLTGCGGDENYESRNERIDRLYSECLDAGGSFEYNGSLPYWNCLMPGTGN